MRLFRSPFFGSILFGVILVIIPLTVFFSQKQQHTQQQAAVNVSFRYASIDTMKESMDTVNHQLTDVQIADTVNLAATLHTTHITVDTFYDYPDYMQRWVSAVRKVGKHVWFRNHFNAWEGQNGIQATMTPSQYLLALQSFILAHPSLYQPGDIFDPNPEPENSSYWIKTWGQNWSWQNAPNAGTDEFNTFILDLTTTADKALHQSGINGVITTIHSMNAFFWERPSALYDTTVSKLGVIALDTYPEGSTTDPVAATKARIDELNQIENIRHLPVIIAEMGYSNDVGVSDTIQEAVLHAELNAISNLSYIEGVNYWVGPGTQNSGGYTYIFTGSSGNWSLRPSANDLADFYLIKLGNTTPSNTPTPTRNTITVDPTSNGSVVNPFDWGVNEAAREIWDANAPALTQALKNANIKIIRLGAVQYSDLHLGGRMCTSPTNCNFSDMDKMIQDIFNAGAEPLLLFAGYPGGFAQHDWNSYAQFMQLVVKRYNIDLVLGKKIRYWQAWNEPDQEPDGMISTREEYATMVKTVVGAMKQVDPNIKVLGPVAPFADLGTNGWVYYTAQNTNDLIDDLDWHNYARHDDTDQARLDKEPGMYYNDFVSILGNPNFKSPTGKQYGVAMTEYNMAGQPLANGNNQEFRTNYNAVFIASAIINAMKAKADMLTLYLLAQNGANTLGLMDYQNNWTPFTPYYTFYLFGNHFLNTTLLNSKGPDQASRLIYIASKDADGKTIHIMIVNTNTTASQTGTIVINGTTNGSFKQYQLDATHIPTTSTTGNYTNGQFSFTLPSTSIQVFDVALAGVTIPVTPTVTGSSPAPTVIGGNTIFSLTLCPHGLGNCGDNANATSGGNTNPIHTSRKVTLNVFDTHNNQIATQTGQVSYASSLQNFQGTIPVSNLSSGQYLTSVKMDGFLGKQIPGIVSVINGQTNPLALIPLVNGDINNDNQLDIVDYNMLLSCFGSKFITPACLAPSVTLGPGADIDDDGKVDGVDYNLFLRELSVQRGDTGGGTNMPTPTQKPPNITPQPSVMPITNNFVHVCGTQFCLNGIPYHVHGATAYGSYNNPGGEMALAKQGNINTLELVEYENNYHSLNDTMSEGTWTKIDKFIAEAGKNGIHIILNFSSYGQSLQAAGQNPTGDWQPFLSFVANRINTVTGLKYANDPTIMMVEFWGEIDGPTAGIHAGTTGTTADITAFFKRSSAQWKALDPNHIVSSGGFSYLNLSNSGGIDWKSIMADSNNQVCDIEINSNADRNTTVPMVSKYCQGLHKPWFLAAWSSCYQAGGGDLTNQPDIPHMTTHAQDMYALEKGAAPASMPAIGSDFWNLANAAPNPGTCDLSPQFPSVWNVIQSN